MKQKNKSMINIGTTSLVLIFAVLALVTFSLLSYASARAQWRMAEKLAERTTQYYEVQRQAAERVEQLLGENTGENSVKEFQLPIGDAQVLQVKLGIYGTEEPLQWEVLRWQMVEQNRVQEEQRLPLFGMAE